MKTHNPKRLTFSFTFFLAFFAIIRNESARLTFNKFIINFTYNLSYIFALAAE
jgi:hypothetical protein